MIVSPSGKVYIGKSTNIDKRWGYYRGLSYKPLPTKDKTIYKELSTGFEGTSREVALEFRLSPYMVKKYAERGTPLKKGKLKGLHFVIIKKPM